jgi:uncharacterized membrane protein YkvA (DUF1232 family)
MPAKKAATAKKAPATKKMTPTRATAKKSVPATKKVTTKKATAKKAVASSTANPARAAPATAANSKFFAAARKRAALLTKDPEKLQKIAEESYRSGAARSGSFTAVMDDFRTLIRLVVAYARGHYREIPPDSLVIVIAGLVYVVSPVDLIPDILPGGFADDAAVIVWVVKAVRTELDNFRAWELGADGSQVDA